MDQMGHKRQAYRFRAAGLNPELTPALAEAVDTLKGGQVPTG